MTIGTDVPICKRKATWSALADGRADTLVLVFEHHRNESTPVTRCFAPTYLILLDNNIVDSSNY